MRGTRPQRIYLRDELSVEDQRDLTKYMDLLRRYFNIPDDQPVFPPAKPATRNERKRRPSKTARNRADHPWRAAVERRRQS